MTKNEPKKPNPLRNVPGNTPANQQRRDEQIEKALQEEQARLEALDGPDPDDMEALTQDVDEESQDKRAEVAGYIQAILAIASASNFHLPKGVREEDTHAAVRRVSQMQATLEQSGASVSLAAQASFKLAKTLVETGVDVASLSHEDLATQLITTMQQMHSKTTDVRRRE